MTANALDPDAGGIDADSIPAEQIADHPEWMQQTLADEPEHESPEHNHHRSIWISDVHLGTKGAKADFLCDFLKYNTCDTLYLVGDIIDGWHMKGKTYWPQAHVNVIRRILTRAKRGAKVVYVTGNHDEFLRGYSGMSFGNIHLVDEYVHEAPNQDRYWVIHGDAFDSVVCSQKWLAFIGDWAYENLLKLNTLLNRIRNLLGMEYWSLSAYLKYKVKKAVAFIDDFETTLVHECRKRGYRGVICGHIHHPEVRMIEDITYGNSGDWVESCSALVEDYQGQLAVKRWLPSRQGNASQTDEAVAA